jgi:hypothetical protein
MHMHKYHGSVLIAFFTADNTTSPSKHSHQIAIWVVFEREFSVCGSDLLLRGITGHAQQLVVVPLRRRRSRLHPVSNRSSKCPRKRCDWQLFRVDFERGKEQTHTRTCEDASNVVKRQSGIAAFAEEQPVRSTISEKFAKKQTEITHGSGCAIAS